MGSGLLTSTTSTYFPGKYLLTDHTFSELILGYRLLTWTVFELKRKNKSTRLFTTTWNNKKVQSTSKVRFKLLWTWRSGSISLTSKRCYIHKTRNNEFNFERLHLDSGTNTSLYQCGVLWFFISSNDSVKLFKCVWFNMQCHYISHCAQYLLFLYSTCFCTVHNIGPSWYVLHNLVENEGFKLYYVLTSFFLNPCKLAY